MTVRDADVKDAGWIERTHGEMGLDYRLPDLNSPLFFVRKVAEKDGRLVGACFLRIAAECYLWLPPSVSPRDKMTAMDCLQPEVLREAWSKGIDSVEARIPETVERRFNKRLQQLGWNRDREDWHPWSRSTI